MDFDRTKKIEVEVTENNIVENEVNAAKKPKRGRLAGAPDTFDIALIAVTIGGLVSLGFLFAGLFRASSIEGVATLGNALAAMF